MLSGAAEPRREQQLVLWLPSGCHLPFKHIFKIVKTLGAYPMVVIVGSVSFVQSFGMIFIHKFRITERAMIVIPFFPEIRIRLKCERDSFQVSLLSLQSPIILFDHDISHHRTPPLTE
jgi:hypothetical protein